MREELQQNYVRWTWKPQGLEGAACRPTNITGQFTQSNCNLGFFGPKIIIDSASLPCMKASGFSIKCAAEPLSWLALEKLNFFF